VIQPTNQNGDREVVSLRRRDVGPDQDELVRYEFLRAYVEVVVRLLLTFTWTGRIDHIQCHET
jgi:hypothetical protein